MSASGPNQHARGGIDWMALLRLLLLVFLATLMAPAVLQQDAVAQSSRSVEWSRFDVTLEVRPDGTFHVTERQQVTFEGGPFRSGFRDVDLSRIEDIGNIAIGEDDGGRIVPYRYVPPSRFSRDDPGTYSFTNRGSDLHAEWAFPVTYDEVRTFVVEYDVAGALRAYPSAPKPYEQISWTAVGTGITEIAPVREATFTLVLPEAVDPAQTEISPQPGNPSAHTEDGRTWTWETSNIGRGEEWTLGLRMPPIVGAAPPRWQETSDRAEAAQAERESRNSLVGVVALGIAGLLAIGGGAGVLGLWYSRGRDPQVPEVAGFTATPPDDLPAGAVGALVDETADEHDAIATLADLGRRGVITIEETTAGSFFGIGGRSDFTITLADPDAPVAGFEQALLSALFGRKRTRGEAVKLSEVKDRFDLALPAIKSGMYDEMVSRGYFTKSPEETRSTWRRASLFVTFVALVGGCVMIGALSDMSPLVQVPVAVLVFLGIGGFLLSRVMPRKTEKGAEAAANWRAFRNYLDDIEKYENLAEARAIFEKYLPYAIAFGLERDWVRKFAAVQAPAPSWYGGVGADPMWGPMPGRGGSVIVVHDGGRGGAWGYPGGGSPWVGGGGGGGGGNEGPVSGWGNEGGFQGMSDSFGRSLQGASGGLFDLFDSASRSFGGGGGGSGGGGGGFN